MDNVDRATRSRMMSRIRGKDTGPELVLRKKLHSAGFRFRLQARELPGRPDIVLPRYRAAVFVHGCFWHRHEGCADTTTPKTDVEKWQTKFVSNAARDRRNQADLRGQGWRVAVVWACRIEEDPDAAIAELSCWLKGDAPDFESCGFRITLGARLASDHDGSNMVLG